MNWSLVIHIVKDIKPALYEGKNIWPCKPNRFEVGTLLDFKCDLEFVKNDDEVNNMIDVNWVEIQNVPLVLC